MRPLGTPNSLLAYGRGDAERSDPRQFWPLNLESIENSDKCHKKDQFAYFRPMLKNAVTEPVTHLSVPPVPWASIDENATVRDAKLAFGIWAR